MRIVFIGTGEIGVPTLQALLRSSEHRVTGVVTQPDKPAGRTQQIEPPPIKRALAGTKMSILQPVRIKGREAIEEVRTLRPEAIVVMAYGQIACIPSAALARSRTNPGGHRRGRSRDWDHSDVHG